MRVLFASMLLGFSCASVLAQQPPGVPPTLEIVHQINADKGILQFRRVTTVQELRQVLEKVVVNGQQQDVTKTIAVPVVRESLIDVNLANARVLTPDNKQLPLDEALKRLKKDVVVAISGDSSAPSAAFLRVLNPQTLIIIPGQPKQAPMPAPK